MKTLVPGGVVRALVALGLVSYHAVPALATGKTGTTDTRLQWVTQLIVKEKSGASSTVKAQSAATDVATVQRWSVAAQLPVTYKRAMSGGAHVVTLPKVMLTADAQTVAARMESTGQFEYVSPDAILRPASTPTDPWFVNQWNLLPNTGTVNTVTTSGGATAANGATTKGGANLTTAWDTTKGSNTVTVTIIDTGILAGHADLSGATIQPGYDFISNTALTGTPDPVTNLSIPNGFVENDTPAGRDSDPTDPGDWISTSDAANYPGLCGTSATDSSWHGTFVTGLIAAQHNAIGVAGVAPGVSVQMARAVGKCGGASSDIIDALTWAAGGTVPGVTTNATPAKVINMSLGGITTCTAAQQSAITAARALGAAVVVATGNEARTSAIDAPANCSGTIAVTAHTLEGDNANYANVGTGTTLSAPGGGNGSTVSGLGALVPSTSNSGTTTASGDTYVGEAGTSMAAPHVAGVAALMLSVNSALTPDQLSAILQQSSRPFPPDTYCASHTGVCGAGMLDAGSAIAQAQGVPTVHASVSSSSVTAGTQITLTAVGGAGYGKTVGSLSWVQTSGTGVTLSTNSLDSTGNATATFTPTAAGTYTFTVTLVANDGTTASDTTSLTVTAASTSGGTGGTGGSTGGSTGTLPFSGGTSGTGTLNNNSGGGGQLPLWLAGLLLAAGAFGFQRRKRA
ncbi:MprA protease, GlyGly-CTERM protein-sorting domain-containing form [Ralstonia syzygii]|uniref:MprA protease, GlyGly-CTERM protein-sorting domain-containing form n=1 Tax=Ralstonia syzygii TaxID=28097 RepID=UPI003518EB1D